MGSRYEMYSESVESETTAKKAVVEPMLMSGRRQHGTARSPRARVGILSSGWICEKVSKKFVA